MTIGKYKDTHHLFVNFKAAFTFGTDTSCLFDAMSISRLPRAFDTRRGFEREFRSGIFFKIMLKKELIGIRANSAAFSSLDKEAKSTWGPNIKISGLVTWKSDGLCQAGNHHKYHQQFKPGDQAQYESYQQVLLTLGLVGNWVPDPSLDKQNLSSISLVILSGAQTWIMTNRDNKALRALEITVHRKVLKPFEYIERIQGILRVPGSL